MYRDVSHLARGVRLLETLLTFPFFWAQTTPDQDLLPVLALQRWTSSLTLSAPEATPRPIGLWAWLLGLLGLLGLAMIAQGPLRTLGQLLDLPGHIRLIRVTFTRLRRASRVVVAVLGATVLAWSGMQFLEYGRSAATGSGIDLANLQILLRSKSPFELALEQGTLAGLMPLRDVLGLADLLLLLLAATVIVFKFSADRWPGHFEEVEDKQPPLPSGWATVCWGALGIYALYRMTSFVVPTGGLPLGGCLSIEALAIPGLMAWCDGTLLAWILVELVRADDEAGDVRGMNVAKTLRLVPAAVLACLLTLPARYVASAGFLAIQFAPDELARRVLLPLVYGWGLTWLQGAALVLAGLAGAVARSDGTWLGAFREYGQLLKAEGGRVVALIVMGGLAAGLVAGTAYLLILSLPPKAWVLSTADAYAHYATLPIGLITLGALVELSRRAEPSTVPQSGTETDHI